MAKLNPSDDFRMMMLIMFQQGAMDEHPDFETRFQDIFANTGYKPPTKQAFAAFMEEAIKPKYSDAELERLFDICDCEWATPRGGHREILSIMLAELRRQI